MSRGAALQVGDHAQTTRDPISAVIVQPDATLEVAPACAQRTLRGRLLGALQDIKAALDPRLRGDDGGK
jgi:hypothetical protein